MIRIGLLGAQGRMGDWVTRLLEKEFASQAVIAVAVNRGDLLSALLKCDAVIDFSAPAAMLSLAQEAMAHSETLPVFVIGSTGWKPQQKETLEQLAQRTPVLLSANFSTGILALQEILREAAPVLLKLGYTPAIVETHHRHKKDSPSGTAFLLQKTLCPTSPLSIQTHSIRAGEIIGDHEVSFFGPGDTLSIKHHAMDRSIFARGAIEAALWMSENREALIQKQALMSIETYFQALKNLPQRKI